MTTNDQPEKKFTSIQAYTLSFEELKTKAQNKETIVTQQGYLICSKDRKFDAAKAKYLWEADVTHALETGKIPGQPKEQSMAVKLNAKGKPFSWSYSALNNFEGCPLRWAHEKFYCDVPWVDSEAMRWGNRVHKAAENFVKGKPVTDPEAFKEAEKYARLFKGMKEKGAEVTPELQITLTEDMKPTSWFAKNAWFRVAIDVPVIQNLKAGIFDYKTGAKVKAADDQLKIGCAALSIIRPELETFTPKLIWTKHQKITGCNPEVLTKEDLRVVWQGVLGRVARMRAAWDNETFQARPSGLCRWRGGPANGGGQCPAYDKCEYHR